VDQKFNPGGVTLAHLACALGVGEILQVLVKRSQANNGVWGVKDEEGILFILLCFNLGLIYPLKIVLTTHFYIHICMYYSLAVVLYGTRLC